MCAPAGKTLPFCCVFSCLRGEDSAFPCVSAAFVAKTVPFLASPLPSWLRHRLRLKQCIAADRRCRCGALQAAISEAEPDWIANSGGGASADTRSVLSAPCRRRLLVVHWHHVVPRAFSPPFFVAVRLVSCWSAWSEKSQPVATAPAAKDPAISHGS